MMKCIINGKIILPNRVLQGFVIIFNDKIQKIVKQADVKLVDYEVIDAKGKYVSPGLIDMHIHGYFNADVSDGVAEGVQTIAMQIIQNGVTAWCPTVMTILKKEMEDAFNSICKVKSQNQYYGARILGVNSEGPFISAAKKGAQAEEYILAPDVEFVKKHTDLIKVLTVAPEVEGALEFIKNVTKETGVLISMGHTNATFEQANAAIDAGVCHVTHLFNAMTALTHRAPGVVGAALADERVSVELIADTFHVNKGLFKLIFKIKSDKLCLITDCIRAGGMPDGDYALGGQTVHKDGIKCFMRNGTIAGSVLKLNQAVYNVIKNTDLAIWQVVAAASLNPAKALKVDNEIGSIEVGKRADIIIVDDNFKVKTTILGGETVFAIE